MDHSHNVTSSKPLEALEYPYQIFLISLYSLTACFAFISNLLTIIVMINGKRCTRDLRKFLINLSVTDLLMAVFTIPFTYTNYMLGRWIFFLLMCPIVNCAQLTTITVSIYTLVAIAIDRYVAIMHPLQKSISWFKQHRTFIVILIWSVGIFLGLSQLIVSETNTFIHDGQQYSSCGERWTPESIEGRLYTAFIFATTFAMPMSALCIIYTAMGWKLLRYRGPEHDQERLYGQNKNININNGHRQTTILTVSSKPSINDYPVEDEKLSTATARDDQQNHNNDDDDDNDGDNGEANINKIPSDGTIQMEVKQNESNHMTHSMCYKTIRQDVSHSYPYQKCYINNHYEYDSHGNRMVAFINKRSSKLINVRRNKVLKMLITIIGVFTICWLPIQIFNILIYFKPNFLHVNSEFKYYAFVGSYFFCHWISMAHSFMNPIIYSFMSKNFRSDMKMIFSNFWYYCLWRKTIGSLRTESNRQYKFRYNNAYYNQPENKFYRSDLDRMTTLKKIRNNQQRFANYEMSSFVMDRLPHPENNNNNNNLTVIASHLNCNKRNSEHYQHTMI